MSKPKLHRSEELVNIKLETSAEKSIGKEINLVKENDFNHLDLVIEAKNNRLKSEFFYIYNYEKFNNCSLLKPNFDIFAEEGTLNHTSARYVIHYLTKELKNRFKEIDRTSKAGKSSLYDVFKPSLGQFDDDDIVKANDFIRKMFPYEGCSYTGEKLESIISKADWITLILGLRLVWSLLPGAIIPWESYKKFKKAEEVSNFSNVQSFYQTLPIFLPSHNHCCVLFEFLEIFIAIFADDFFVDLGVATDLIFTAGQICFNRDEFKNESESKNDDDLHELQHFYYKRGSAFYHLFVAYLRSLSKEPNFEYKALLDSFKIDEYPPKPYKPVTQKALTLTVPSDVELETTNYFKLISNAANATSRVYSSNHNFTKFENKFLDKFEVNPHKIIENFFSKSSKNYLLKFDKNLDFDNFKVNSEVSELRKNLKNGTLFDNKELISTFINDFSRYGFESQRDNRNNNETFIADTINFNFNSDLETVDNLPVRVSKLEISEWFINAWKYETFLGYLQNTVVLKLTKTIGDCDWLIITSHDKVSSTNRYLTPPSSAQDAVDDQKEKELGGSLADEDAQPKGVPKKEKIKTLLPPLNAKNKHIPSTPPSHTPRVPSVSTIGSKPHRKSPRSHDLKRISFPSPPQDIEVFEKGTAEMNGQEATDVKNLSPQKRSKRYVNESLKPLPAPIIPNQRITTPTQQQTEFLGESNNNPPPLLKDPLAADSLTSVQANLIASQIDFTTPKDIKYISPRVVRNSVSSKSEESPKSRTKHEDLTSSIPAESPSSLVTKEAPKAATPEKKPSSTLASAEVSERKNSVDIAHSSKSELVDATPRSPNSSKPSHPYQQLKSSPPRNINLDDRKATTPVPTPPATLGSTSHFQTPPSPVLASPTSNGPTESNKQGRFGKKLSLYTNTKSSTSSKSSPIAQALPKFFKKSSSELSKIPSSESSNSLSFINDGSTPVPQTASPKGTTNIGLSSLSRKKSVKERPSLALNNPELNISTTDVIPEIPYTPRALRNSSLLTLSNNNALSTETLDLNNVLSEHRDSFVGDVSLGSEASQHFDSNNDLSFATQDTTKNTITGEFKNSDIDLLLEEIKESMDPVDADMFFSVEDLSKVQNVAVE